MPHESNCGCCGCKTLNILRIQTNRLFYKFLNERNDWNDFDKQTESAFISQVRDGEGPLLIAPSESTWVEAPSSYAGRGGVVADLWAHRVTANIAWLPLFNRGSVSLTYESGSPMTEEEKKTRFSISLFGSQKAELNLEFVERIIPPLWFDNSTTKDPMTDVIPTWHMQPVGKRTYNVPSDTYSFQSVSDRRVRSYKFLNLLLPLSSFNEWPVPELLSVRIYTERTSLPGSAGWTIYSPLTPSGDQPQLGYDARPVLSIGGSSRLINFESLPPCFPVGNIAFSVCSVTKERSDNLKKSSFFTAHVGRGSRPYFSLSNGVTGGAQLGPSAPAPRKFRTTFYCNGSAVFSANDPTVEEIEKARERDGVYLRVDEPLEPTTSTGGPAQAGGPEMLKKFSSFIQKKGKKPVVGFTGANDIYVWAGDIGYFPETQVLATEPVYLVTYQGLRLAQVQSDEDPTSVLTRPAGTTILSSSGGSRFSSPGTYTLGLGPASQYKDIADNSPASMPTFSWTAHEFPADMHLGAQPKLEHPGLQTREYWRPRLDTEPVSSLLLTFDRKVKSDQVVNSQLTLTKDGQIVPGCTLQQVNELQWRVTIPAGGQTPRSFWMLTYDPGGNVFTDDIVTLRFDSRSAFPAVGQTKTVYVYKDASGQDVRFSYGRKFGVKTGPYEYVQLGASDPPIDWYGYPYNPEPCRLATRVGWLMADMDGYPRLIDCSYTTGQIGRTASVSSSAEADTENGQALFQAGGDLCWNGNSPGTFSPGINYDGYTPQVPSLSSLENDASYFGLRTTIDPSPPALISECAAPKVEQKHASAIRCDGDILSLQLSVQPDGDASSLADFNNFKYEFTGDRAQSVAPVFYSQDFVVNNSQASSSGGYRGWPPTSGIAMYCLAKSPQGIAFSQDLNGMKMSQNVWASTSPVPGEIRIGTSFTSYTFPCFNQNFFEVSVTPSGKGEGYPYRQTIPFTFSQADVVGWDVNPDFKHYLITRNGVPMIPNRFMPGDKAAGTDIPWWQDRLNSLQPSDYVLRGEQAWSLGRVRAVTGGTIEIDGIQATLSARRGYQQYLALKTTTLGELCVAVSIRATMKATVNYQTREIKQDRWFAKRIGDPNGFAGRCPVDENGNPVSPTFRQVVNTITVNPQRGPSGEIEGFNLPITGDTYLLSNLYGTDSISYAGTWENGNIVESRTLTHRFCGDIDLDFVLTAEQEKTLATGGEVTLYTTGYKWTLKRA